MKVISEDEFLGLIRARVTEADSQSSAARALGVSKNTISLIMRGKMGPAKKLLRVLGYERVSMYRRIK